jgi:hypothetical protein
MFFFSQIQVSINDNREDDSTITVLVYFRNPQPKDTHENLKPQKPASHAQDPLYTGLCFLVYQINYPLLAVSRLWLVWDT